MVAAMSNLTAGERFKANFLLKAFALKSIPLILLCRPKVLAVSSELTEIVIPLTYITKNHLGSMYFGALAVGADVSVGLHPAQIFRQTKTQKRKVSFAFKDMKMNFLKRPDGDVHFKVAGGKEMDQFVETVLNSDVRHHLLLKGTATVPKKYGNEPVATYELTLSAKSSSPSP